MYVTKTEKQGHSMAHHIFAGRFQPFHLGHMEIVEQSLHHLDVDDILVIGVITSMNGIIVDDNFAKSASEHHLPERNPWLPIVPLRAINCLCSANHSKQILTTILPCPDTSWTEITKWFPMNRKWIVPYTEETFDDIKADFYRRHGESVIRYSDNTRISGRELREFYKKGEYDNFKKFIPAQIVDIYWNGEKRQESAFGTNGQRTII